MKVLIISLIIIAVLMFMTNPSMDDFGDHLATQNGGAGSLTKERVRSLAASFYSRDDYYLFSTYTGGMNLFGDSGSREEIYLGMFKTFIRIDNLFKIR